MTISKWTFRNWLTVLFFVLFMSDCMLLCTAVLGFTSWTALVVGALLLVVVIQWTMNIDLHASIEDMLNYKEDEEDELKTAGEQFKKDIDDIYSSDNSPEVKERIYHIAKAEYDSKLRDLDDRTNVANVRPRNVNVSDGPMNCDKIILDNDYKDKDGLDIIKLKYGDKNIYVAGFNEDVHPTKNNIHKPVGPGHPLYDKESKLWYGDGPMNGDIDEPDYKYRVTDTPGPKVVGKIQLPIDESLNNSEKL